MAAPWTGFRTLFLLALLLGTAPGKADEVRYSVPREVADWSLFAGVTAASFWVDTLGPLTDEPLIDSPYTNRPEVDTVVPGKALHIESAVFAMFMTATPTNEGWLTHTNYANLKGFMTGLFAANLVMNFTKVAVGRKRPNYDDHPQEADARKSFVSGHATCIWYDWTYLTLFAFEHLGNNRDPWHLMGKSLLATTGVAVSTWVSYTRVNDNQHFVSDVVAGGALGALFALGFYAYQNEWLFQVYDRDHSGAVVRDSDPWMPALGYADGQVLLAFPF